MNKNLFHLIYSLSSLKARLDSSSQTTALPKGCGRCVWSTTHSSGKTCAVVVHSLRLRRVFTDDCCYTESRTALRLRLFVPSVGLLSSQPEGSLETPRTRRSHRVPLFISVLINVCRSQQAGLSRGPPEEVPQPGLQVSLQRPDAGADPQGQLADHPARPAVRALLQQALQHVPQPGRRYQRQIPLAGL